MVERRVSVRIAAVGGDRLKADLVAIGREGATALKAIEGAGAPASRGLGAAGDAAGALGARLDALASKASAAAANMRGLAGAGSVVARVDAATGVSGGARRDAADFVAYGRALDETRAKYNPVFGAIRQYRGELGRIREAHAAGAISAAEMVAAIGQTRRESLASIAAIKGRSTALRDMGTSSRFAAFQQRMLMFQLNDIAVSLGGGQKPMTVLLQQGSQIVQMYAGQGGVSAALRQVGSMARSALGGIAAAGRGVLGLAAANPVVAAGAAAAALAMIGLRHEINAASDAQVSFGDTALAVWQTFSDGVWGFVKPAFDAIATWAAPAFDAVAGAASVAWDAIVAGVHFAATAVIKGFQVAVATTVAYWSALPPAVGAAAIAAANAVLRGVEYLINAMSPKINEWIGWVNDALGALPDWARPDWAVIPSVPAMSVGQIDNPFATDLEGQWADYKTRMGEIVAGDPVGDVFGSIRERAAANARGRAEASAGAADASGGGAGGGGRGGAGRGGADRGAGDRAAEKEALTGLAAVRGALDSAYEDIRDLGKGMGDALVGAFDSAEQALGEFVKTGKLDMRGLVTSIITDFAQLGARKFLFGPLSSALSSVMGGFGGSAIGAAVQHTGGAAGFGPARMVPAVAFAHAPRLHSGTPDWLRADEHAAILQRGERVLSRRETLEYEQRRFGAAPVVNIYARDAQSFRQSRTQVAADLARAAALGRRGM